MDALKMSRTPLLNDPDPQRLRETLRRYFQATFSIEEKLYETLADDGAFYLRADPLRHPIVFYLGHTAAFFINKLIIGRVLSERINPAFESMFAIGVDEMSWDDLNSAHYNWPPIPEVRAYRDLVRARVDRLISDLPLDERGITWDSPWWAIIMGAEHCRIHLETSSVLIRQLPLERVKQLDFWAICTETGTAPRNELLSVEGGKVSLGRDDSLPLYGWDNEYGSASYDVEAFRASKYLVSNAEFLEFVKAGGYARQELWTEEGWAWKSYQQADVPRFWIPLAAGGYKLRLMACEIPLPLSWPAEVNYLEAKAFCNWKAEQSGQPLRLPSEEEWMLLRDRHVLTDQPWWDVAPGNINLEHYCSPCPVNRFACGPFHDLIGNIWQWTETPIHAFPGFKVHPIYDDFSVPTFDGRHNLIKGGSWISTGNETLRNSRYAFRRHFYQHAGFRYVESAAPVLTHEEPYESDPAIIPWCDADWGKNPLGSENFALQLLELLKPWLEGQKALHLGCKTGRGTFELARHFGAVTGLDFTTRLIRLATQMREKGFIRYLRLDEGENQSYLEKWLRDFGLQEQAERVEFWQADVSNLAEKYGGYDFILAENAIEGAINPLRWLQDIHTRLSARGILAIADSYAYDPAITLPENRIGGFRKDGEPFSSLDGLKQTLGCHFELLCPPQELLQTLRQSEREYTLKKIQLSIWRRRA